MEEKTNLSVAERDAENAQRIEEELADVCTSGNKIEELINAVDDRLPEFLNENEKAVPFTEFIGNVDKLMSTKDLKGRIAIEKEREILKQQLNSLKSLLFIETNGVFRIEDAHFISYVDKEIGDINIVEHKYIEHPCYFLDKTVCDIDIIHHRLDECLTLEELQTFVEEIIKKHKEQIYGTSTTEI